MKKQIISLVTGGAGFIGSHVVDNLISLGHKVVVVDDLNGGFVRNVNKDAVFFEGSVTDVDFLEKLFNDYDFTYVYHLAAYAAEGLSHFIRKFNYQTNLVGSINLINLSVKKKVKRFIFTSSIAVYGTNQTPMIETLSPLPEDPYGISKYAIEMDLKAAHNVFGLNYTIFRPHNVYGERQNHGDPYRNVLGIMINKLLKGECMPVYGDGKQTRAFTYVGDVAPHIANCVNIEGTENEIFNIGADTPYTVLEIATRIAECMGMPEKIEYQPKRVEVVDAYSDHSKFKKVFHVDKTTSLDVGIPRMVEWAKKVGPMNSKKFGHIEVEKNLPPSWKNLI